MQTESISVESIQVGPRKRSLVPEKVQELAGSIAELGLCTPVTVRTLDVTADTYALIAGYHRLEAARQLGWTDVPCFVLGQEDEDFARRWEIAENLHRADLTALERDEHIAEWIRLTQKGEAEAAVIEEVFSQVEKKPKGGRPEGGINAASRELGIDKNEAYRAVAVDSISPEAKEAAKAAGLDDNRSALLNVAKAPNAEAQLAAVKKEKSKKEAKRRNKEADSDIACQSAEDFAGWLFTQTTEKQRPTIITWLMESKARDIAAALRRLMVATATA